MAKNLPDISELTEIEENNGSLPSVDSLVSEEENDQSQSEVMAQEEGSMLGQIGAGIRSVSSGAMPGQNQISAAISSAVDYVTVPLTNKILGREDELRPYAERYSNHLQQIKEQDIKDSEVYPVTTTVSNLVGNVGGLAATGGALGAVGVSGKIALASADATFMAAQHISENNTLRGADKEFGMAFVGDLALQTAMGPLGKLVKGAGSAVANAADNMLIKSAMKRVVDLTSDGVKAFQEQFPDGTKKVMKMVGNLDELKVGGNAKTFKEAVLNKKNVIGKQVDEAYNELDALSGGIPIFPKDLVRQLNSGIDGFYKSEAGKASSTEVKQQLQNMLIDPVTGDYYVKSAKELFNFRKDFMNIAKNAGMDPKLAQKIKVGPLSDALIATRTSPRAALTNMIEKSKPLKAAIEKQENLRVVVENLEDAVKTGGRNPQTTSRLAQARAELLEASSVVDDAAKQGVTKESVNNAASSLDSIDNDPALLDAVASARDKVNKLSKDYEMLSVFENKVLSAKMPETTGGSLVDLLKAKYVTPAALLGVATGGVSLKTMAAVGIGAKAAQGLAIAVENYSNKTSQALVRESGQKMAGFFKGISMNPNDPTIRAMGANVVKALINEEESSDNAWANIQAEISKFNLYQDPLERTERSFIEKFDDVMSIATVTAPQLANSLAEMQNSQEDIGPIMDQLSKEPSMMKFFKAGLGWDGHVYSPEDKALLVNQINQRVDVPTVERKKLINQVMSTGEIPDLNQIKVRQPFIYKPRDRSKER